MKKAKQVFLSVNQVTGGCSNGVECLATSFLTTRESVPKEKYKGVL